MRHLEGVSEIWEGLQRNGYTLGTTERVSFNQLRGLLFAANSSEFFPDCLKVTLFTCRAILWKKTHHGLPSRTSMG